MTKLEELELLAEAVREFVDWKHKHSNVISDDAIDSVQSWMYNRLKYLGNETEKEEKK
jgi:hypothetical protein